MKLLLCKAVLAVIASQKLVIGDVVDLIEDGFEANPPWFFGLIAECGGEVVGHALCNRAYSSWTRRAFYVEDLYVLPGARRRGVGICLLRELCRVSAAPAAAARCSLVGWLAAECEALVADGGAGGRAPRGLARAAE